MRWNNWTILVLGLLLVVSPWILGFSAINLAAWNNIALGAVIIVLSLWNLDHKDY